MSTEYDLELDKILTKLDTLNREYYYFGTGYYDVDPFDSKSPDFIETPKEILNLRNELAKLIQAYGGKNA